MSRLQRNLPFSQFSFDEFQQTSNYRVANAWRNPDAHIPLRGGLDGINVSDQLFDTFDKKMDDRIQNESGTMSHMDLILLHGKNLGLGSIFDRIGSEFRAYDMYRSKSLAFSAASQGTGHKTVFAVDLDALGYVDRALPKLIRLRKRNPLLTVLILSSHFNRDDLSGERAAIADASIKLPSNASGIMRGIGYAVHNAHKRN
ncbi:hypothetical protein [Puniceibacterium sp. IMCC21224]|uniref:hypothetical protein n=1 Tax=Puniceibacterium sp. IMCC21224 TaxID=1618204 RepID=UPI00064E12CB|nr:hypothetical protein [Puniceibacterium sp. IMCC21224]KMK68894.1 hypothetical protein IMCC21224_113780 [Puniceibacterium sp. IMCC21224]